jgi:DNA-directed RNA polymerase subunit RPC12/RpoP
MDYEEFKKIENREYMKHFNPGISKEIEDFADEEALKFSRYIFTHRKGKKQYGYCTHCKKTFLTPGLIHNMTAECPYCHSRCYVKASGRGRSKMIDETYFVYYEKSAINHQAIVARGIFAVRDYTRDYMHVDTKYLEQALYIFEMGNSTMLARWGYYSMAKTMQAGSYEKRKSVSSLFGIFEAKQRFINTDYSLDSIKKAVKNTPFQYSTWDKYNDKDMVKFFDLYSKYPCVEYLTKLGFTDLIEAKLNGYNTYSAINWRGSSLLKVLKLSKTSLNTLKNSNIAVNPLALRLFQISEKDGSKLLPIEIEGIVNDYGYYYQELNTILKHASLRKVDNYINKQHRKFSNHFRAKTEVVIAWKDYISDCITLEMDLKNESVIFPKSLYDAHQNTIKQVKVKANELLNAKISQRAKSLERYCFEYKGLLIRPAESSDELIAEGKALSHCVGTYAERYAKGETTILLIRKQSESGKPYFTMEVKDSTVVQVRGLRNCSPDERVKELVEAFKAERLELKKKNQNRIKVSVPA